MSLQDAITRNRARQAAKRDAVLTGRHDAGLRAFTVNVENAKRDDVFAIRAVTDQQQQLTPPVFIHDENTYAEPRNWAGSHQRAFIEAAHLHFSTSKNKILTIKFLRSLSEPCLTLKDAKDLADYAIHGPVEAPLAWIKNERL